MSEQQVTTDTSGVNRTADGQITTQQATDQSQASTTQTTETKATNQSKAIDDKASDDKASGEKSLLNADAREKSKASPDGAPESYSDYKVPEGFTLDPEIKTAADKLFKGMNLSQAQAQELVDFYAAQTKEAFEAPFNAYQEQRKEWRATAEADPDLRGKLGPGGEVLTTISKAIDGLGDAKLASDFREAMDLTGAGDNPAFIRAFFLLSRQLTEGSHVAGRGPSPGGQRSPNAAQRSPASDLWPNLPSAANQR